MWKISYFIASDPIHYRVPPWAAVWRNCCSEIFHTKRSVKFQSFTTNLSNRWVSLVNPQVVLMIVGFYWKFMKSKQIFATKLSMFPPEPFQIVGAALLVLWIKKGLFFPDQTMLGIFCFERVQRNKFLNRKGCLWRWFFLLQRCGPCAKYNPCFGPFFPKQWEFGVTGGGVLKA